MNEVLIEILDLLKYTVPAGIVFLTSYYLIRQFLDDQRKLEIMKAKAAAKSDTLNAKLQAYERLILLLERIEPNSLISRIYQPAMSAQMLKRELLKTIRNEFEHNLTQQLYVSNDAWSAVVSSKDTVMQVIQLASEKMNENSTGAEFSSILFEIIGKAGVSPTAGSVEKLKQEARQLL